MTKENNVKTHQIEYSGEMHKSALVNAQIISKNDLFRKGTSRFGSRSHFLNDLSRQTVYLVAQPAKNDDHHIRNHRF